MTEALLLSVILPIYNEEAILEEAAEELAGYMDGVIGPEKWQFVLVDNGSKDSSPSKVRDIVAKWPLSLSIRKEKADYGKALRVGLEAAQAPWAYVINVEQWDIPFLEWAWKNREHYDLFLGSKRADPTLNHQSAFRRFLSWGLNCALSLLFEYIAIDSHGPKVVRMETLRPILRLTIMNRGQFDTEFSIRALRARLWIAEAPVVYTEKRPARNWMITKIVRNLFDLIRLRQILATVPYEGTVRFRRWCREDIMAESTVWPSDDLD